VVRALELQPIGVLHTPYARRAEAPRQALTQPEEPGTIELYPGRNFEQALSDLDGFAHIWVLFWFDQNQSWRPKVRPPRSALKRGVFSTRSPYRPNPIGLSLVRLEKVEGLSLRILGVDMLDNTPVLDLKPYLAYADAPLSPHNTNGWLEEAHLAEEHRRFVVCFAPLATAQLELLAQHGVELRRQLETQLGLGPTPHAYRRIRRQEDGTYVVASQSWRARFGVTGQDVLVSAIFSGYRDSELARMAEDELPRVFTALYEPHRLLRGAPLPNP
jgi:tRNA-Thr(GGU) m(6)t(6)A37 methyltransferase TsaA